MEKDEVKVKEISYGEVRALSIAIDTLMATSPTMNGKIIHALTRNENIIRPILKSMTDKEHEEVKAFVELDKKGEFKFAPFTQEEIDSKLIPVGSPGKFIYKDEVKGPQEFANKMNKYFNETFVEGGVEFYKIWKPDFDKMEIAVSRNPNIGLIIDNIVSDNAGMQKA